MDKVTHLKPCSDTVAGLRSIADSIEKGNLPNTPMTLIMGDDVFQIGIHEDDASAESAVFSMVCGIHNMMKLGD